MTQIEYVPSRGYPFGAGEADVDAEWQYWDFTQEDPFIGLYGFESGDGPGIAQLGYLTYNCTQVCQPCTIVDDRIVLNFDKQDANKKQTDYKCEDYLAFDNRRPKQCATN